MVCGIQVWVCGDSGEGGGGDEGDGVVGGWGEERDNRIDVHRELSLPNTWNSPAEQPTNSM